MTRLPNLALAGRTVVPLAIHCCTSAAAAAWLRRPGFAGTSSRSDCQRFVAAVMSSARVRNRRDHSSSGAIVVGWMIGVVFSPLRVVMDMKSLMGSSSDTGRFGAYAHRRLTHRNLLRLVAAVDSAA